MTFDEHLEQILMLLQRDGRVTYRALKRRLEIEDDYLSDLTAEIIEAKRLAIDEDGRVLVWIGVDSLVGPEKMKKSKADGDYSRTQRG